MWSSFSNNVDNAFFFVIDKIIDLQNYFLGVAWNIGRVVLLIAILTAGLNYALTGTGLKENIIKIIKATIFFFIVWFSYPIIIGFISSWTLDLAKGSIYPPVRDYFLTMTEEFEVDYTATASTQSEIRAYSGNYFNYRVKYGGVRQTTEARLFAQINIDKVHNHPQMPYRVIPPAELMKVVFLVARIGFEFADNKDEFKIIPEISRILKGLIIAFFVSFTGIFAILEYIICFLEFMLVSSVGVILLPMSIWEGSKFLSESFIKVIIGFFMKMLFCQLAIFLMLYGFISLYAIFNNPTMGFTGGADQIIFTIFVCLMFFFICKSAPALAQSLMTGTPNLNAAGAIAATAGAVGAVAAVGGYAKNAAGAAKSVGGTVAGGIAKSGLGIAGSISEAGAASNAVKDAGGSKSDQRKAFMSSIGSDIGDSFKAAGLGLVRNLAGGKQGANPHSWRKDFTDTVNNDGTHQSLKEHIDKRKDEGAARGEKYAKKHNIG